MPQAIKGQALADFLAAHPVPNDSLLNTDLPDEEVFTVEAGFPKWEIYFCGAPRTEQMEGQTPPFRRRSCFRHTTERRYTFLSPLRYGKAVQTMK